jgi:glycerol-3-phosphate dehydrogenase
MARVNGVNVSPQEQRNRAWLELTGRDSRRSGELDILVIGGGITGAGILREAARHNLAVALIEQRDFAWGTSSRSSKMVHGGLRYLLSGQLKLTWESVRERERLLREAPGLVDPMGFLYPCYKGHWPGRWSFSALLNVYDILAQRFNHRYLSLQDHIWLAPHITRKGLTGGIQYGDAVTDDARLVFRTIREAERDQALALNYVAADGLIIEAGRVCGVGVRDVVSGETGEVYAKVVVNATGAWADRVRKQVDGGGDIRPLRGSHLVFPFWRLPVAQAIVFIHPWDRRPVFVLPWEGATIVGNTDLDHKEDLDIEASITAQELDYLLTAVHHQFPSLRIDRADILSTYSAVRPVIGTGMLNPSKEKRDHSIWVERGLISVSGGKLTTFRLIARDVLERVAHLITALTLKEREEPFFNSTPGPAPHLEQLDQALKRRLRGRYGTEAEEVAVCAKEGELVRVPGTDVIWAELRWAARTEAVVHLEDLLLRRTQLGILLPEGGMGFLDLIRSICREELGWNDERWRQELYSYRSLWRRCHGIPGETDKRQNTK